MSENKLIILPSLLPLTKAENIISVTQKLLQKFLTPEQKKLIEFLIKNSKINNFTIELLSKYFPFTKKQLEEYKEVLDWREIGSNENLSWNYELIYHFKNEFFGYDEGDNLSYNNRSINWTPEIIKLSNDSSWESRNLDLTYNERLIWSLETIEAGKDFWYWENLSRSHNLPWSIELIDKFSDKWDWSRLSVNTSLPWSQELIEKFSDKWTWQFLADNTSLPWSIKLIDKFFEKQNSDKKLASIYIFSRVPCSAEIIEHFKDKLNWKFLSKNQELSLSIELIDKYSNKWDWDSLNENKGIYFEVELIEKYKTKTWITEHGIPVHPDHPKLLELIQSYGQYINLKSFASTTNIQYSIEEMESLTNIKGFMIGLSSNPNRPWSFFLIDYFHDFWDWEKLSSNLGIVWTIELIEEFQDYWVWERLSYNRNLPWTVELIAKFKYKLKFINLIEYPNINWSEEFILNLHTLAYCNYLNSDSYGCEEGFKGSEIYHVDWKKFWESLNYSPKLPWNKNIIENFIEDIDWFGLSIYGYFVSPLALLGEYKDNWNWVRLSSNEKLTWSEELINNFKTEWDWVNLSRNEKLPWSKHLIEKYEHMWDWESLSGNIGLPWSEELIENYQNKWSILYGLKDKFNQRWAGILIAAYNENKSWPALIPREIFHDHIYSKANINDEAVKQIFDAIKPIPY